MTVVIPTRDRAELLPGVVGAILTQSWSDLEVIVVDDGSVDGTPGIIEAAVAADSRVRGLRHETPRGAAAARNTGAAQARGRYLLFEDDDCVSEPDKIESLVAALEVRSDAAYAYGWVRMRFPDGSVGVYGRDGPWSISTSCALIRRTVFRQVGGFDEQLPRLQDFDLFTRLLGRHSAAEVGRVLFEMRRGEYGISASNERLLAAGLRLLAKYRGSNLPRRHRAAMHRRLGGKLLVRGFWKTALDHYLASVRACPQCPRSWAGLCVALMGPAVYRGVARIAYRAQHRGADDAGSSTGVTARDGRPS